MHFLCPRILGRVRRLLFLVSTIIFVDALLFTALTPLIPEYAEEFHLSKAGAGLLVGAYGAGALLVIDARVVMSCRSLFAQIGS